jgi:hypothetical protein
MAASDGNMRALRYSEVRLKERGDSAAVPDVASRAKLLWSLLLHAAVQLARMYQISDREVKRSLKTR